MQRRLSTAPYVLLCSSSLANRHTKRMIWTIFLFLFCLNVNYMWIIGKHFSPAMPCHAVPYVMLQCVWVSSRAVLIRDNVDVAAAAPFSFRFDENDKWIEILHARNSINTRMGEHNSNKIIICHFNISTFVSANDFGLLRSIICIIWIWVCVDASHIASNKRYFFFSRSPSLSVSVISNAHCRWNKFYELVASHFCLWTFA